MAEEQPADAGRRRSRGPEATARSGALERLKALRSGGRRSDAGGFQIKMENPIYDVVEEDEYETLVAKRREEARGFIVDDDGLGYGDEGEEEDWSRGGLSASSGESDGGGEPGRPKRKKVEKRSGEARPKRPPSAASASLSAAAAMMGKQRLSSMFTSSVFKKSREEKGKGLSCDSVVDDVIAEFAPDEADRERRRRVLGGSGVAPSARSLPQIASVKSERASTADRSVSVVEPPRGFTDFDSKMNAEVANGDSNSGRDCREIEGNDNLGDELGQVPLDQASECTEKKDVVEERSPDFVEAKAEEATAKKEKVFTLNAKIVKEEKDPAFSATAGWKAVRNEGTRDVVGGGAVEVNGGCSNSEEITDFDLDSDGSLPFYILDAHEEFYGVNMGNLYLFGKVN